MNHLFYLSTNYFIPGAGFLFGVLLVLLATLIEYCFLSSSGRFVQFHIKLAKILLSPNTVFYQEKHGGRIVFHGYHFRKIFPYICVSECVVAGTIFLFTLANIVTVPQEPCNVLTRDSTCYNFDPRNSLFNGPANCSQHLENGTESNVICFNVVNNFGTGLAVLGSLLYLLPLVYSNITSFIVHNSAIDMFPSFMAMVQVLMVLLFLLVIVGFSLGLVQLTIHPSNFMQIVFLLLFLIYTFAMPWCCLDRNESIVIMGGELGQSGEYAKVDVDETSPLNHSRRPDRNGRASKYRRH